MASNGGRGVPRLTSPAATLPYVLLDVLTDTPFTGNALAVFVDPGGLSDGQMQRIAAELHLPATVFVWSPARPGLGRRTRTFTPSVELRFAGHATIGTGFLLAALGHVDVSDDPTVVLDQALGAVEVIVADDGQGVPIGAEFVVAQPCVRVDDGSPAILAAAAGLEPTDLHPALPVREYSAGVPVSIIPVADTSALRRCHAVAARWAADVAPTGASHLYLVTPLDASGASCDNWRARMLGPTVGIAEDLATEAAAAFAGYLDELRDDLSDCAITIESRTELARPSRISVRITHESAAGPPSTRVGGNAVFIGRGTLVAPPANASRPAAI